MAEEYHISIYNFIGLILRIDWSDWSAPCNKGVILSTKSSVFSCSKDVILSTESSVFSCQQGAGCQMSGEPVSVWRLWLIVTNCRQSGRARRQHWDPRVITAIVWESLGSSLQFAICFQLVRQRGCRHWIVDKQYCAATTARVAKLANAEAGAGRAKRFCSCFLRFLCARLNRFSITTKNTKAAQICTRLKGKSQHCPNLVYLIFT